MKNSCHSGSTEVGVLLEAGIDVVDVGGVGALQKRRKGKGGVRVLARHDGVLVIFVSRPGNADAKADRPAAVRLSRDGLPYLAKTFAPKRTKD